MPYSSISAGPEEEEPQRRQAWRVLRIVLYVFFYLVSLFFGVIALSVEPYRYAFIPGNEHIADSDQVLGAMVAAVIGLVMALPALLLFIRSWKMWLLTSLLFVLSGMAFWQAMDASSDVPPPVVTDVGSMGAGERASRGVTPIPMRAPVTSPGR
ncbi:hypothetical protein [Herbidospora sp. RD11066]